MLCGMVGLVLFAAGLPLRTLALPAVTAVAGAVLYVAVRPYARARVRGFFDPWQNAHSEGFQLVQSFVAFGRGGSTGVGLGNGRQKLFYLPEAHTDFILSVVAEELGLLGVLFVIGAFAALCWAGLRVARNAREPFALLLATGMTALIVLPALCNAAVVMGLLPTTGLTLPFMSHGSNSLVCSAVAIGILLRVANESNGAGRDRRNPRASTRLVRA
jgi:cell division protein FtsW